MSQVTGKSAHPVTISKIKRLKGFATFRDFSWPPDLHPFSRYNLIYGWNATGKTTLSRLLQALERGEAPACEAVTVEPSGGGTVTRDQFPENQSVSIRVYNSDFVTRNVFPSDGNVPPVFVLGEQRKEDQAKLEQARTRLTQLSPELGRLRSDVKKATKAVEDFEKDRAKSIKDALQPAGLDPYRNYNRAHFESKATQSAGQGKPGVSVMTETEREAILVTTRQQRLGDLQGLPTWLRLPGDYVERVLELLSRQVAAQAIEEFLLNPGLARWVEEGLRLHPSGDRDTCKFCMAQLSGERIDALEGHFNDAFTKLMDDIDSCLTDLKGEVESAHRQPPDESRVYTQFRQSYAASVQALETTLAEVKSAFSELIRALDEKKENAFAIVDLDESMLRVDVGSLTKLNELIENHNKHSKGLDQAKKQACAEYEEEAVRSALPKFMELVEARRVAQNSLESTRAEIEQLQRTVPDLEQGLQDHRTPAEELNRDLVAYLGHDEIQFEAFGAGYRILRRGKSADRLSEGERTAISVLYFLRTLTQEGFDLRRSVIVLDDPVSSLDEGSLYSAYGFIQKRTCEAAQVIVLTHNFTFFRLVRDWLSHCKSHERAYFSVVSIGVGDQRCSDLRPLDPMLERYHSEYHFLFSLVQKHAEAVDAERLEAYYQMPNVARRLLEAFFAFRKPGPRKSVTDVIRNAGFDGPKTALIIRFCHTYSHNDVVSEPAHDPSVLSETGAAMRAVLELMAHLDQAHVDEMKTLCARATPNGAAQL
ncbi:MAG: AAA family ATPase [Fimbriimonadaceae bacterium]|nr:AAA family ATPase [Fimbriimonadaceae bacterium]QYK58722.1 MAG: AAA family ATPase [Fimbriimonadaceae bacterium]